MPRFEQKKILPHCVEDLAKLVLNVERYPSFLPWCKSCTIIYKNDNSFIADTIIRFKIFTESFRSKVDYEFEHDADGQMTRCIVNVHMTHGPMKYLINKWVIEKHDEHSASVSCFVDFSFKSEAMNRIIDSILPYATYKLVRAFEEYAKHTV